MTADGIGGPKDDVAARALFEKAAAQDHPGALERMGAFAQSGRGGPQDANAAKAYYEKAAALGNEDAKAALKRAEMSLRDQGQARQRRDQPLLLDQRRNLALLDENSPPSPEFPAHEKDAHDGRQIHRGEKVDARISLRRQRGGIGVDIGWKPAHQRRPARYSSAPSMRAGRSRRGAARSLPGARSRGTFPCPTARPRRCTAPPGRPRAIRPPAAPTAWWTARVRARRGRTAA